jgi:hypothetical protein
LFEKIADRLLNLPPMPEADCARREPSHESKPKPNTRPSHDLAAYAGEYEHPAYGVARIERQNGGLKVSFPALAFNLTHFHYDVFQGDNGMLIQFQMNEAGDIDRVLMPLEPAVRPIVFTRKH